MSKRVVTMKEVSLLLQLHQDKQLIMAPEFQRNSVWPRSAKAYLIDTILNDRPIPFLYFRRITSAQTGRSTYEVIDGQQRLRAIFEFLDNRFSLTETKNKAWVKKRFNELSDKAKTRILSYDLYVEELTGYSDADIRDMFVRMNRFLVKLSPQEIRHAKHTGSFAKFAEKLGDLDFWRTFRVFTPLQLRRMRAVEFSAELAVLITEGPQDKKAAIDLYYAKYESRFPFRRLVETRLAQDLIWVTKAIPKLSRSRFRKPVDLYSLIGAIEQIRDESSGSRLPDFSVAGRALADFEQETRAKEPTGRAARYLTAASRQTDNIAPRTTRIEILRDLVERA